MPSSLKIVEHRAEAFFNLVEQRHAMYVRRQQGLPQSQWTEDPTLATRKFTNVFRWLDPGSQFVLTDLLTGDEHTDLYRCIFYRYTNAPATWRWLREELGHYPRPLDDQQVVLDLLRARRAAGHTIFSGAYMIIPQPGQKGDKVLQVVDLVNRVMKDFLDFVMVDTQAERHAILKSNYGVGNFLALQILTDFMYVHGTPATEDEFVVSGPGSERGAALVCPTSYAHEVIRWAHEELRENSLTPRLLGKTLSVMDVQNCFCEYSKFVKGPRANVYRPAHPGPLPEPVLPIAYERKS